ncbi:TOMM precursor leader peptide-binding protein [Streptomyces sp. NBC_01538]|uniref:TOMM precursor leader peptide-binding protein n=1 Tax=Streptomyces sp. NBC_01538 TaxID=2903897 RepID=UPI00386D347A
MNRPPAADAPTVGFKRHLRVQSIGDEAVYLLSTRGVQVLHGPQVVALAPLLDGTRTLPGLLREAASRMPAPEAGRVVGELAKADLIGYREGVTRGPADTAGPAYWDLLGDGSAAIANIARTAVEVISVGRADRTAAADACRATGLTVVDHDNGDGAENGNGNGGPGVGLSLVLCDDYLAPELGEVDLRMRAAGRPWLPAKPCGPELWVGPVFSPGDGPCWSCLAHRLRTHRSAEEAVCRAGGFTGPLPVPDASLAAGRALGIQAAALEAAKWIAGVRQGQEQSVYTLDTCTLRSAHHPVARRPQCPVCGDSSLVARRAFRPPPLASRPKAAHTGSNHRALTPRQVLESHRHLADPVTGIVAEITPDPNAPTGVTSYLSGHNLALAGHTPTEVRRGLRQLSGGKGVTAEEAEAGALCEAVERFCGTRQGDEAVVLGSLEELGEAAVHPNTCQLFHERQFRDRARWNATHSAFQQVCAPFDPRRTVEWTPVHSLTTGRQRLLPTSMLYFSHSGPKGLPWADSNGNAAGSSLEDAIVQGFLELVERDAVALWWYNRTRQPALDLDAFDEPWLAELRETYGRLNREMWALDLTSDLGVPVTVALSRRTDKPAQDIAFGFGAHFDPRLALRRAVTEMGQLLSPAAGARADGTGYGVDDPEILSWWTRATVGNQPYLLPDSVESPRSPTDFSRVFRTDLLDDVKAASALVARHGMELLVLDQTLPDVGLPVVKVMVPGLRHYWARFAPGRLYDVPVRLGLREQPVTYEDLNPVPIFA